MKPVVRALCAAVVALCLHTPLAHASVVIAGTRVVFAADQGEATVRLTNKNTRPALVEAWIDTGDMHSTPDSVHTPFLITPPLFRMNANKDQSLRVIYIQGKKPLPGDRESLFWLNVLEVPPKPTGKAATQNVLRFAIRTRIKLFYRPADLAMPRIKAPAKLTWSTAGSDHGVVLKAHNPTPYYITLSKVTLDVAGQQRQAKVGMVAPLSDLELSVPGLTSAPAAGATVTWSTINDYGAEVTSKGTTTP